MTRDTYLNGKKSPKVSSKRKGQVLMRVWPLHPTSDFILQNLEEIPSNGKHTNIYGLLMFLIFLIFLTPIKNHYVSSYLFVFVMYLAFK